MAGLFSKAAFEVRGLKEVGIAPRCGLCQLHRKCHSPKLPVQGEGRLGILIINQSPTAAEDKAGAYLAGKAGYDLRMRLQARGINIQRDCWYTSALICRAGSEGPTKDQIEWCRPALLQNIKALKPRIILPIGKAAVQATVGHLWKEDVGAIDGWVGWQIPSREWNAWICPLWHSSDFTGKTVEVRGVLQDRHIRDALSMKGTPWPDGPPDYEAQVDVIMDTTEAARIIRRMIHKGGTVAFDYETNMLNAFAPKAQIVTCSVCWEGKKTIAYPWQGEAIKATSELLLSDLKKIGANLQFETRWTIAHLGHSVTNWVWDTVQAAHILNSAKRINSVKFQGFVLDGQPDYKSHIEAYLESAPSQENQIRELNLRDLLQYNGVDSVLEFVIAKKQATRARMVM